MSKLIDWFEKDVIPQVEVSVGCDEFENTIRKLGVGFACEYFAHDRDSDFAKETVNALCDKTDLDNPFYMDTVGDWHLVDDQ